MQLIAYGAQAALTLLLLLALQRSGSVELLALGADSLIERWRSAEWQELGSGSTRFWLHID